MPVKLAATVLYPAKNNKESQHNPGQYPIKWKINDSGDEERTWHYESEAVFHLRKGAQAQLQLNGKKWEVVPDSWQESDIEQPSQSTSQGLQSGSAPSAPGRSQPLDVVGSQEREAALHAELILRMTHMNLAVKAAAKSLAQNTGNWQPVSEQGEPDPKGRIVDPTKLSQEGIYKLANTLLMGLYDERSYFGGKSQTGGGE